MQAFHPLHSLDQCWPFLTQDRLPQTRVSRPWRHTFVQLSSFFTFRLIVPTRELHPLGRALLSRFLDFLVEYT